MKIALLTDHVINQIAAGEVIENPASVIKELVDNAIDAGASRIDVEIQAGGQQLIKVDDDGCGMSREDVEMCLMRHATSKLRALDDLESLQTMGFRGEALAAIAAISKLEIRTSDGMQGTRLVADGGQIVTVEPCARNRGTTIEVRSIFFNTPARRKFQKSPQANASQATRTLSSMALAEPSIAFSLKSAGQIVLDVKATTLKERAEQILGEIFQQGIWFDKKSVKGWLGLPDEARVTRSMQHFFVNRRPIFSPLLSKAAREGYGTRINSGSHPAIVLFYECSADEFDVNVHPQKKEIRFREEGRIFCRIRDSIQQAFLPNDMPLTIEPPVFQHQDPWDQPFQCRDDLVARYASQQQDICESVSLGQPLAVVGSFLLALRGLNVVIVDLREALEDRAQEKCNAQSLMVPILCSADDHSLSDLILRCREAGVDAKAFGARQIAIDAIPEWLSEADAPTFIEALKEDLDQNVAISETIHRFCQKSQKQFTLEEAQFLWNRGHGKEVLLESQDLERILLKKS